MNKEQVTIEQCDDCGEYFDSYSEGISGEGGFACESCRDNYFHCTQCEEYHKNPETANKRYFVLSTEDAENQDMKPGLYRGKDFPIYSSNMFTQSILQFNVELVIETAEFLETGFICEECFKKHLR